MYIGLGWILCGWICYFEIIYTFEHLEVYYSLISIIATDKLIEQQSNKETNLFVDLVKWLRSDPNKTLNECFIKDRHWKSEPFKPE